MARTDGTDRVIVRNQPLKNGDVIRIQQHNERQNQSYSNDDIVPQRSEMNIHFKTPAGSYEQVFSDLKAKGVISTRGLKADAVRFDEMVMDVNTAYFHKHGGYAYARKFYTDAYAAAVQIVGGDDYVVSAVMHADEKNLALSEELGRDVYHYHLHVVYVPVVEKQILWSRRCKDASRIGTVKETVMQVSNSKKWASQPVLDEEGQPMKTASGKVILRQSYSVLQDRFYQSMLDAGYVDIERGERGSTQEHLAITQFKVKQEKARLSQLQQKTKVQTGMVLQVDAIDRMGRKNWMGKEIFTPQEMQQLKRMAKNYIGAQRELEEMRGQLADVCRSRDILSDRYMKLKMQTRDFAAAFRKEPKRMKQCVTDILLEHKQRERKARKRSEEFTR